MVEKYALNPQRHTNSHFDLKYDFRIFIGDYIFYYDPVLETYPTDMKVIYLPPNSNPTKVTVPGIPKPYNYSTYPKDDQT